jgi:sulfonate dioxygenase
MAPGLLETLERTQDSSTPRKPIQTKNPSVLSYSPGFTSAEDHSNYGHEDLKPHFPQVQWPALKEIPYEEKGLKGHHQFHNLLSLASDVWDYSPRIGTEVEGVDLKEILDNDAAKNDLARLIATRGVVFFRNQENLDIDSQRKLGEYFGSLHKHATTSMPLRQGLDDVHVVYSKENSQDIRAMFSPEFLWHSDVSFVSIYISALHCEAPQR